jgi:hypothetical protein
LLVNNLLDILPIFWVPDFSAFDTFPLNAGDAISAAANIDCSSFTRIGISLSLTQWFPKNGPLKSLDFYGIIFLDPKNYKI